MKEFWLNLSQRDRLALLAGTIVFTCYLMYILIYSPLQTSVASKYEQLNDKQQTLAWLKQVQPQISKNTATKINDNGQLLSLISSNLTSSDLKKFPYILQQTGGGDIQLDYDAIPYNAFLQWLWTLSQHYSFTIKQLTVHRTKTVGVVQLSLTITSNAVK